jgi:hypothetical protein
MKNLTKIGIAVLAIAVAWHIKVALTSKVKLTGVFMAQPAELGFAWEDSKSTDERFFWQNINAKWQAGIPHPDYKAWSDTNEGLWVPFTGYKFIYEGDTFVDSVWDPGKRYDDLKLVSLQEQDQFAPYPGYNFVNNSNTLKVVWTPGLVNSENNRLIAGRNEGTWEVRYNNQRSVNPLAEIFVKEAARRVVNRAFYYSPFY